MSRRTIIKKVGEMNFPLRKCRVLMNVEVAEHPTGKGEKVGRIYVPDFFIGGKVHVVLENERKR